MTDKEYIAVDKFAHGIISTLEKRKEHIQDSLTSSVEKITLEYVISIISLHLEFARNTKDFS